MDLSWLNMASKTPPRRLQDAFKAPPRRLQDGQDRLQGRPKGFQMLLRCPRSPPRPPRHPPDASRYLQDVDIASKTVQNVRKLFQKLTCLPCLCQLLRGSCQVLARFKGTPEMFCPQWPSAMADCQVRGRLPRVVWRCLPARASSIKY